MNHSIFDREGRSCLEIHLWQHISLLRHCIARHRRLVWSLGWVFCSSDPEISGAPDTHAWKKLVHVSSLDPRERSLWQPEPLVNERIRAVLTWLAAQRRAGTRERTTASHQPGSLGIFFFARHGNYPHYRRGFQRNGGTLIKRDQ